MIEWKWFRTNHRLRIVYLILPCKFRRQRQIHHWRVPKIPPSLLVTLTVSVFIPFQLRHW